MIETFLCFESEDHLFLVPLTFVRHILPGNEETEGLISFGGREVKTFDIASPQKGERSGREYVIVLRTEAGEAAVRADGVAGVIEIPDDKLYPLPQEVIGEKNDFLTRAAFVSLRDSWAFEADMERFLETKAIETKGIETKGIEMT